MDSKRLEEELKNISLIVHSIVKSFNKLNLEAQSDKELETSDMHNFKELPKSIHKVFFYLHTYIAYIRINNQQLIHVGNI